MFCKNRVQRYTNLMWLVFIMAMLVTIARAEAPLYEASDCNFPLPDGAMVDCGSISVPQNRADEAATSITLPVAVFRSEAANPAQPLIFLQGGPGGATLELTSALYEPFIAPLLSERDVILFDQRGTGQATPSLACPEVQEATLVDFEAALSPEETADLYITAFTACAGRLQAEGVDVSAYTSAENAADVAAIIEALGYEQAHLYGASYGTRLAQTVVRDFPDVVASVIIDLGIPIEINLYEQQAAKTAFALDRIFAACAADPACASAYPDLEATFYDTIAQLDASPATLAITNPMTGASYDAIITGTDYVSAIFIGLQVPQLIPTIPQTIHNVANGDYADLATPLTASLILSDAVSLGMFTSVNCHEEVYASTVQQMTAIWNETPQLAGFAASASFGNPATILAVCEAWGASAFDAREVEPVMSDVPMLGLAGEFDPATPVTWTEQIAANFTNSVVFEFPGQTHTPGLTDACAVTIVQAFLSNPSQMPDATCLDAAPPVVFAVPEATDATPQNDEMAFAPYENAEDGWSTVVPAGWTMADEGVFARGELLLDPTVLIVGEGSSNYDEILGGILTSLSIADIPEVSEMLEVETGTWHRYTADGMGGTVSIAIQDRDEAPYLVVLITAPDEHEDLSNAILYPVVEAFAGN